MDENELIETRDGGVVTLTFNRPKARNALNGAIFRGLLEALPRLAGDASARAVVVTGAGGAFSAGGDVGAIDSASAGGRQGGDGRSKREGIDVEAMTRYLRAQSEVSRLLHEMPKPTIAAIPGAAAGAGFSLALACDLRIATETAKLTTAFSRLGMSGDLGGSYFLTQLIGAVKARELYFFGEVITGLEAERLGIVNQAVPEVEFTERAAAFARRAADLPTVAIGYMKRNLNAATHRSLSDVLDMESEHMIRSMTTEDHRRGVRAYLARESAEFVGR